MNQPEIIDAFNRSLNYLRISITDRCNLRCLYCTPEGKIPKLDHTDILRYEEILRVVKVGAGLGIKKIRVTGGEPLVRKGVTSFLYRLKGIEGIEDVSLTTNGILLKSYALRIYEAGIRRINISLDTLDPKSFKTITGYDELDRVLEGIEAAEKIGLFPIKINVVALKGINDHELLEFGKLSIDKPYMVRFIEYMPIGKARIDESEHLLTQDIKKHLESLGTLHPIERTPHDGPATRYRYENAKGEIGFISPVSNHFCSQCNRLRLTANGFLRACLLSDHQMDIKRVLRRKDSDEAIAELFRQTARKKNARHSINDRSRRGIKSQMSDIGG